LSEPAHLNDEERLDWPLLKAPYSADNVNESMA